MFTKKGIRTTVDRASTRLGSRPGWRAAELFLVLLWAAHPGKSNAQATPEWVSSTRLVSADGFATLRWSVEGSDKVELFRISEIHSGQQQISFTDQVEMRLRRSEPGEYHFWIRACDSRSGDYPHCGEASAQLTLIVLESVLTSRIPGSQSAGHRLFPVISFPSRISVLPSGSNGWPGAQVH
jgi:hypothetical protein